MISKHARIILTLVLIMVFMLWIAAVVFYLAPKMLEHPDRIDPMLTLVAGLGVGGVTQAIIVLLTLSWQYFFRKKESQPQNPNTSTASTT